MCSAAVPWQAPLLLMSVNSSAPLVKFECKSGRVQRCIALPGAFLLVSDELPAPLVRSECGSGHVHRCSALQGAFLLSSKKVSALLVICECGMWPSAALLLPDRHLCCSCLLLCLGGWLNAECNFDHVQRCSAVPDARLVERLSVRRLLSHCQTPL